MDNLLYVLPLVQITTNFLDVNVGFINPIYNQPGIIHDVQLSVQLMQPLPDGGIFKLYFDQASISDLQFQLMRGCQLTVPCSTTSCEQLTYYCSFDTIDQNLLILNVSDPISQLQTFNVSIKVQNPQYSTQAPLGITVVHPISGYTLSTGYTQTNFIVSLLNTQSLGFYNLWGFPLGLSIPYVQSSIYRAQSESPRLGPFNGIQVGFQVLTSMTAMNKPQHLTIYVQATAIILSSITNNFPNFNTTQQVYCTATSNIICYNVGILIPSVNYFISFRAYFSNSVTQINNFCSIQIRTTSINNQNLAIYSDINGYPSLELSVNTEYLDSVVGGWHEQNVGILGDTQVVSAIDDQSLSSTPNALNSFFNGQYSNVGVFPDQKQSQQLLFFTKVPIPLWCPNDNQGNQCQAQKNIYTRMTLLFNSKAIGFDVDQAYGGIDIASWNTTALTYELSAFPCYSQQPRKCDYYQKQTGSTRNSMSIYASTSTNAQYGVITFDCGITSNTGNTITQCDNFRGTTGNNLSRGVFSLRHVRFSPQFYQTNTISDMLLDFIISFSSTTVNQDGSLNQFSFISSSLLNVYSLSSPNPSKINVNFINLYTETSKTNQGYQIPSMLQINGNFPEINSLLSNIQISNIRVLVFLDQWADASNFLEDETTIGCSTICQFFNEDSTIQRSQDNFLFSPMTVIQLPWISQSKIYNLVFPFKFLPIVDNRPKRLIISIAQISTINTWLGSCTTFQLYKTYRLSGLAIQQQLQATSPYNSLIQQTPVNSLSYTNQLWSANTNYPTKFQLNSQKIPLQSDQTLFQINLNSDGTSSIDPSVKGLGSGITIVSLDLPLMGPASFNNVPADNSINCIFFTYLYNCLRDASCPSSGSGKRRYINFCPTESLFFNLQDPSYYIKFQTYGDVVLPYGFGLSKYLSYGYSGNTGILLSINQEPNTVGNNQNIFMCLAQTNTIIQSGSSGYQSINFTFSWDTPIIMDVNSYNGYNSFQVKIIFDNTFSDITFDITFCLVQSGYSCILTQTDSYTLIILISQQLTIQAIQQLQIMLKANTDQNLVEIQPSFNVKIILPNTYSSYFYPDLYTEQISYAICQSSQNLQLNPQPYRKSAKIYNIYFQYPYKSVVTDLIVEFSPSLVLGKLDKARQVFQSQWEYWLIDLSQFASSIHNQVSSIQCVINNRLKNNPIIQWQAYQNLNQITLSSLNSQDFKVKIQGQQDIKNPEKYIYQLVCSNVIVPTTFATTFPKFYWYTSGSQVIQESDEFIFYQTLNNILSTTQLPTITQYFAFIGFPQIIQIDFDAFNLNTYSHISFSLGFNDFTYIECFWKNSSLIINAQCEILPNLLTVQVLRGEFFQSLILAQMTLSFSTSYVYLNLMDPLNKIFSQFKYQLQNQALQVTSITVLSSQLSFNYTSSFYNTSYTLFIPSNLYQSVGNPNSIIFVDIPACISIFNVPYQYIQCTVTNDDLNIQNYCQFISQSRIKITLNTTLTQLPTTNIYVIQLYGIRFSTINSQKLARELIFITSNNLSPKYIAFERRDKPTSFI